MTTEQRIQKFNEENRPFYIVDLESGRYSLCLPLDLLGDEFYPYCQGAFDAYAGARFVLGEHGFSFMAAAGRKGRPRFYSGRFLRRLIRRTTFS